MVLSTGRYISLDLRGGIIVEFKLLDMLAVCHPASILHDSYFAWKYLVMFAVSGDKSTVHSWSLGFLWHQKELNCFCVAVVSGQTFTFFICCPSFFFVFILLITLAWCLVFVSPLLINMNTMKNRCHPYGCSIFKIYRVIHSWHLVRYTYQDISEGVFGQHPCVAVSRWCQLSPNAAGQSEESWLLRSEST